MNSAEIKNLSVKDLVEIGPFECECEKTHSVGTKRVIIESGAIRKLPNILEEVGSKHPFILSGHDTFEAAGDIVESVLNDAYIPFSKYVFPHSPVVPNEESVGSSIMHFDNTCDCICAVGSGVINDIGKILANVSGNTHIIIGTAPSMDGFASATSSMDLDGLKVSLPSTHAYAVIGDLDILCKAPAKMLQAGVGDLIAKYVSLVEWKISHIVADEYYCPVIAEMVRAALNKVVNAAPALLRREPDAVAAVMEGQVIAGMAMKYAGISSPASGVEHYFSHVWDMRSLSFEDAKADLHGIQCGIGTLYALKIYDMLKSVPVDVAHAKQKAAEFDFNKHSKLIRDFIGKGADAMIEGERKERKYDLDKHDAHIKRIEQKWEDIMALIKEVPSFLEVKEMMESIGAPTDASCLGYTPEQVKTTFILTKDIRDKYVLSRLVWELGLEKEALEVL